MPSPNTLICLPLACALLGAAACQTTTGSHVTTIIVLEDDASTPVGGGDATPGGVDATGGGTDATPGGPDAATPDVKGPLPGQIGANCFNNEGCGGGICLGYEPGYCSKLCTSAADCDGGACAYDGLQGGKVCFRSCTSPSDCQEGNVCAASVCKPRCTADSCPNGMKCNDNNGLCEGKTTKTCDEPVPEICGDLVDNDCNNLVDEGCAPMPTPGPVLNIVDFGQVEVGAFGTTDYLKLTVLPGVMSFELITISSDSSYVGLYGLDGPGGKHLVDLQDPFGGIIHYAPSQGVMSVLVSNTPNYAVEPGVYEFSFFRLAQGGMTGQPKPAPGWMRVFAIMKFGDPAATTGKLDVAFHFVKGCGMTAAKAQYGIFPKVVNQVKTIYQQIGITLDILMDDFDGPGMEVYTYIDSTSGPDSEVAKLMKMTAPVGGKDRLDVFFVKHINNEMGNGYVELGQAGGLPGPARLDGTQASGVIMGMDTFDAIGWQVDEYSGIVLTATTLAHEMGHFLGLFHVVEQNWAYDPIPDTPECPKKNGLPDDSACGGAKGSDNLMFWSASGGAVLSAGQGLVVRNHPEVQP